MATWHQLKSKAPLFHATQWTVLIDPPNEMRACMLFPDRELAEKYIRDARGNGSRYAAFMSILKPAKGV